MSYNGFIAVIHDDGLISFEDSSSIQGKTPVQILNHFHPDNFDHFILAIRSKTHIKKLPPDVNLLDEFPSLIIEKPNEEYILPDLSLNILDRSEEQDDIIIFHPVFEIDDKLKLPPFTYHINPNDYSKYMDNIKLEIIQYLQLDISNPKIIINDVEEGDSDLFRFYSKSEKFK